MNAIRAKKSSVQDARGLRHGYPAFSQVGGTRWNKKQLYISSNGPDITTIPLFDEEKVRSGLDVSNESHSASDTRMPLLSFIFGPVVVSKAIWMLGRASSLLVT